MASVTPFLWFDGQAEEAMRLYVSLFGGSVTAIEKYGPGEHGKEGSVKRAEFAVGGHRLRDLSLTFKGGEVHAFVGMNGWSKIAVKRKPSHKS